MILWRNIEIFLSFFILIPTPDFPHFYRYMLGGNLGSLLYGDVSVMKLFILTHPFPNSAQNYGNYGGLKTLSYEPRCEKTGLRGFRPGPTQTGLYSHRRWLEAGNFGFR